MGEYADMMLDGTCCAGCGEYMGDGLGFAQYCRICQPHFDGDHNDWGAKAKPKKSIKCPECSKRFTTHRAMKQHHSDKHTANRDESDGGDRDG